VTLSFASAEDLSIGLCGDYIYSQYWFDKEELGCFATEQSYVSMAYSSGQVVFYGPGDMSKISKCTQEQAFESIKMFVKTGNHLSNLEKIQRVVGLQHRLGAYHYDYDLLASEDSNTPKIYPGRVLKTIYDGFFGSPKPVSVCGGIHHFGAELLRLSGIPAASIDIQWGGKGHGMGVAFNSDNKKFYFINYGQIVQYEDQNFFRALFEHQKILHGVAFDHFIFFKKDEVFRVLSPNFMIFKHFLGYHMPLESFRAAVTGRPLYNLHMVASHEDLYGPTMDMKSSGSLSAGFQGSKYHNSGSFEFCRKADQSPDLYPFPYSVSYFFQVGHMEGPPDDDWIPDYAGVFGIKCEINSTFIRANGRVSVPIVSMTGFKDKTVVFCDFKGNIAGSIPLGDPRQSSIAFFLEPALGLGGFFHSGSPYEFFAKYRYIPGLFQMHFGMGASAIAFKQMLVRGYFFTQGDYLPDRMDTFNHTLRFYTWTFGGQMRVIPVSSEDFRTFVDLSFEYLDNVAYSAFRIEALLGYSQQIDSQLLSVVCGITCELHHKDTVFYPDKKLISIEAKLKYDSVANLAIAAGIRYFTEIQDWQGQKDRIRGISVGIQAEWGPIH
jgi:hypothetical protein